VRLLTMKIDVIVKPHPNCPIDLSEYPMLDAKVNIEPIEKLLRECDMVYTGPQTSSAVDAFCMGIPVITVREPGALNLSPLRSCKGVLFVGSPRALGDALTYIQLNSSTDNKEPPKYFNIDANLPRWLKLLQ